MVQSHPPKNTFKHNYCKECFICSSGCLQQNCGQLVPKILNLHSFVQRTLFHVSMLQTLYAWPKTRFCWFFSVSLATNSRNYFSIGLFESPIGWPKFTIHLTRGLDHGLSWPQWWKHLLIFRWFVDLFAPHNE